MLEFTIGNYADTIIYIIYHIVYKNIFKKNLFL